MGTANSILKRDYIGGGEPLIIGEHYFYRFLSQHLKLHKMKQKPIKLVRKIAHNPIMIRG
jgi:hypothetical protein